MNHSKLSRFYFFIIFFLKAHFISTTQFDLNVLKNKPITTQKKVDTVIVKKKGALSTVSFFNFIKNTMGFSFIFERIIPNSWKKVLGFRRASFINFLTTITLFINLSFAGYYILHISPFIFKKISFFDFQTYQPKPLDQVPVSKPVPMDPVVVSVVPEPVKLVPVDQKPLGEFE